jgi:hypothetical protein
MLATKQAKQRVSFENILLATDFLPAANAAMSYSAGLARSFGARILSLAAAMNLLLPHYSKLTQRIFAQSEE